MCFFRPGQRASPRSLRPAGSSSPGAKTEIAEKMAFTIKINGVAHSVDVDDDTPFLGVLRDLLGMTGTKCGCGAALCGACTVHIDGQARRSCVTPISSIGASA